MKISTKVTFFPKFKGTETRAVTGTVIWEHPRGRFVLVEYNPKSPFGQHKIRECLQTVDGRVLL